MVLFIVEKITCQVNVLVRNIEEPSTQVKFNSEYDPYLRIWENLTLISVYGNRYVGCLSHRRKFKTNESEILRACMSVEQATVRI